MSLDVKRIEKNNSQLRKLLKKSSKLMEPREVHRLRTNTRELEAVLNSLQLNANPNERRLLRRLGTIRRKAGKVRDMDVLTWHLAGLSLPNPADGKSKQADDDNDCLVPLLEYLGERRYRHARQLRKTIAEYGPDARRRMKKTASRLEELLQDQQPPSQNMPEAGAKVAEAVLHISEQLAEPVALNHKNLHPYRKTVKRLRYVLQAIKDHPNRELIEALGKCKDAIGEWHDWDELIKIATHEIKLAPNCDAVRKLSAIRDQKYAAALAFTNKMRAQYPQFEAAAQRTAATSVAASQHSASMRSAQGHSASSPAPASRAASHATNGHRRTNGRAPHGHDAGARPSSDRVAEPAPSVATAAK